MHSVNIKHAGWKETQKCILILGVSLSFDKFIDSNLWHFDNFFRPQLLSWFARLSGSIFSVVACCMTGHFFLSVKRCSFWHALMPFSVRTSTQPSSGHRNIVRELEMVLSHFLLCWRACDLWIKRVRSAFYCSQSSNWNSSVIKC